MKDWIIAAMLLGGLAVAMSDGPWFPWINFFGLVLFGIAGYSAILSDSKKKREID